MTFTIDKPKNFELSQIFDCGQCFRFSKHPTKENTYCGVAHSKYLEISENSGKLIFHNTSKEEYEKIWHDFFDLDNDYSKYIDEFSDDAVLKEASEYSHGIRLLKQDKWETLCSFIISQNNNIPRIKGIIENLSVAYGEKHITCDGFEYYDFPTPTALKQAGIDGLLALKTGFRAKYIYDAACKVSDGEINLDEISGMDLASALDLLMTIKGVGPKVAACVLLFGFAKYDAFPVDVWVKRILNNYYSQTVPSHLSGKHAGIAQQYLFYYERCKNNVFL